jgi:hypothetical protein
MIKKEDSAKPKIAFFANKIYHAYQVDQVDHVFFASVLFFYFSSISILASSSEMSRCRVE